ncbi:hypothetical protein VTK56DRAFT_6747 [Thermocarpiscus australiensis]
MDNHEGISDQVVPKGNALQPTSHGALVDKANVKLVADIQDLQEKYRQGQKAVADMSAQLQAHEEALKKLVEAVMTLEHRLAMAVSDRLVEVIDDRVAKAVDDRLPKHLDVIKRNLDATHFELSKSKAEFDRAKKEIDETKHSVSTLQKAIMCLEKLLGLRRFGKSKNYDQAKKIEGQTKKIEGQNTKIDLLLSCSTSAAKQSEKVADNATTVSAQGNDMEMDEEEDELKIYT